MDNRLGSYIKDLRLKHNYSTKELSEITLICESYIIRIEQGLRKNPSKPVLQKLANVFNIDVKEFNNFLTKKI